MTSIPLPCPFCGTQTVPVAPEPKKTCDPEYQDECFTQALAALRRASSTDDLVVDRDQMRHFADEVERLRESHAAQLATIRQHEEREVLRQADFEKRSADLTHYVCENAKLRKRLDDANQTIRQHEETIANIHAVINRRDAQLADRNRTIAELTRANKEAEQVFLEENARVRDLRATIQWAIKKCEKEGWYFAMRDLLPRLRKSLEGSEVGS